MESGNKKDWRGREELRDGGGGIREEGRGPRVVGRRRGDPPTQGEEVSDKQQNLQKGASHEEEAAYAQ